ncbi:MAG: PKD domain-containing protein, partial [Desulfomonilia bacterium]
MSTTRLILLARSFAVIFIIALSAGCWGSGAGSGHKPAPESLSVIITSPTSNVTISQGQSVDFQAKVSGGTSPYTYLWDFDGGANDKTVENTGMVPFESAGNYTVKLTATDAKGVAASASVVITVNDGASDAPPGVSYTSPSDGATNIAANA